MHERSAQAIFSGSELLPKEWLLLKGGCTAKGYVTSQRKCLLSSKATRARTPWGSNCLAKA
eukprot:3288087-Heterocapsa_arctica.AAC.1